MRFGFLLDSCEIKNLEVSIVPLSNYLDTINCFYKTAEVHNGWLYSPVTEKKVSGSEQRKFDIKSIKIRDDYFQVTPTHEIQLVSSDADKEKFLILCYGFLNGVYLFPENTWCLNRIPYEIGKLTGVVPNNDDKRIAINKFINFYNNSNPNQLKSMKAILHWFLLGQTYRYEWDIFDSQYKVLDSIYKLSALSSPSHAQRPIKLAEYYKIVIPSWAKLNDNSNQSILSKIRNDFIHEAKYAGEPIGYKYPESNIILEFINFNTKLIASLFDFKSTIFKTDYSFRGIQSWGLS